VRDASAELRLEWNSSGASRYADTRPGP
jgi:hypothetical protein